MDLLDLALRVFIVAQAFGILLGIVMAIAAAIYVGYQTLRKINYKG